MSWREQYDVHPAADLFPMMDDAELDELAADIKANGLRQPLVFDRLGKGTQLLDGRNRAAALERIGWTLPWPGQSPMTRSRWLKEGEDPIAYVVSANVRRRHLTRAQKREVIAALLKLDPGRSDRQVAKDVNASPTTVGTVRSGLEAEGRVSKLDTRTDAAGRRQPARRPSPGAPPEVRMENARKAAQDRAAAAPKAKPKLKPINPNREAAVKRMTGELKDMAAAHRESFAAIEPGEVSRDVLNGYAGVLGGMGRACDEFRHIAESAPPSPTAHTTDRKEVMQ